MTLDPLSEPLLEDLKDLEVSCSPKKFEMYQAQHHSVLYIKKKSSDFEDDSLTNRQPVQ